MPLRMLSSTLLAVGITFGLFWVMQALIGEAEAHGAQIVTRAEILGGEVRPDGGTDLDVGGAEPMRLGGRVLRAETAVFVGLTLLQHRFGDM